MITTNPLNKVLENAIVFATQKHMGQTRWDGTPYILHPLRVMLRVSSMEARIVAILHDVLEDTDATLEDLRGIGLSEDLIHAVFLMTHPKRMPYEDYVLRMAGCPLAVEVKIEDLTDNLNIFSIGGVVTEKHFQRLNKYLKALNMLKNGVPSPTAEKLTLIQDEAGRNILVRDGEATRVHLSYLELAMKGGTQ